MVPIIQFFIIMQILFSSAVSNLFVFVIQPSNGPIMNLVGENLSRAINTFIGMTYLSVAIIIITTILEDRCNQKMIILGISWVTTIIFYIFSINGLRDPWGLIVLSLVTIYLECRAAVKAFTCYKLKAYRSMLLISFSATFATLGQFLRLEEVIFHTGSFYYLQFTWKTNFLLFSNLILNAGVNTGYFLFSLEYARNKAKVLSERTNDLEIERNKIERLLRERDGMIISASRLSSLNKISIYTAAIIHEISQPLNALKLAVGNAIFLAESKDSIGQKKNFEQINIIAQEIQAIIKSLRSVIVKGRADVEILAPQGVLSRVIPIISGECKGRGLSFESDIAEENSLIEINATLLQRVIFNLSANAIEALSLKKDRDGLLKVRSYVNKENDSYYIELLDNSDTMPFGGKIPTNFELISDTEKEDGMGLGLSFSNSIINSLNGDLKLSHVEEGGCSLIKFSIRIPLIQNRQIQ